MADVDRGMEEVGVLTRGRPRDSRERKEKLKVMTQRKEDGERMGDKELVSQDAEMTCFPKRPLKF